MTILREGNLEFNFNHIVNARKFDDSSHGLSHCMKAVDFIVELPDRYLFIEVKNPQDAGANEFIEELKSGEIDEILKYKYRDSFLYEWASGRANKDIDYLVLIALSTLKKSFLRKRSESLKGKLPVRGPQSNLWPRPIIRGCGVFNIASWNRKFPDYQVKILP